jgi:hypothetical protein
VSAATVRRSVTVGGPRGDPPRARDPRPHRLRRHPGAGGRRANRGPAGRRVRPHLRRQPARGARPRAEDDAELARGPAVRLPQRRGGHPGTPSPAGAATSCSSPSSRRSTSPRRARRGCRTPAPAPTRRATPSWPARRLLASLLLVPYARAGARRCVRHEGDDTTHLRGRRGGRHRCRRRGVALGGRGSGSRADRRASSTSVPSARRATGARTTPARSSARARRCAGPAAGASSSPPGPTWSAPALGSRGGPLRVRGGGRLRIEGCRRPSRSSATARCP